MLHAGTKEREILDELLTDPAIKYALGREVAENLIERIASDLILENDELKSQVAELEDQNSELQNRVATFHLSLSKIQRITDSLVSNGELSD